MDDHSSSAAQVLTEKIMKVSSMIRTITFFSLILSTGISTAATKTLLAGEWAMFSVPLIASASSTVTAILGDELPVAEYGQSWVLYKLLAQTETENARYVALERDSRLEAGIGYWVIQTIYPTLSIDIPSDAVKVTPRPVPGCSVNAGCFAVPLASRSGGNTWNFLGYPFDEPATFGNTAVVADTGECQSGCRIEVAAELGIMHDELWRYVDSVTGYEIIAGSRSLEPFDGFWAVAPNGAAGKNAQWLVPYGSPPNLPVIDLLIEESLPGNLTLNLPNDGNDASVSWEQLSGPATFITEANRSSLSFIAPNVQENTDIVMRATVSGENGTLTHYDKILQVVNRAVPTLTSLPQPNAFSSPNISKYSSRPTDANGLPLLLVNGETAYYPVTIAAWAYDSYAKYYISREAQDLDRFLTAATWLRDNCVYTAYGFCSYRSYFPLPDHHVDNNWTSAMAQGQALSSLIAAHYLTGDSSYAVVAYDALAAYLYPVDVKGLYANLGGKKFYEEYGSVSQPSHVLNGFIFSLSGVHDFIINYDEDYAQNILDTGTDTLRDNLHRWDAGFTSLYDLSPDVRFASTKSGPDDYHELHVFQLGWLHQITGEPVFKEYAARFLAQDMGGLQVVRSWRERVREIRSVVASHTIDPVLHGVDRLTDANWTWLKYWSSNQFPVTLELDVNPDIVQAGVLKKLVLVGVAEGDIPTSMDLFEILSDGSEQLIKASIEPWNSEPEVYPFLVNGYSAHVVTLTLDVPVTSNKLRLVIHGSGNGVYTRFREIDLQYTRESLLDEILDYYK